MRDSNRDRVESGCISNRHPTRFVRAAFFSFSLLFAKEEKSKAAKGFIEIGLYIKYISH